VILRALLVLSAACGVASPSSAADKDVEAALVKAKDNRPELEKALKSAPA
jgi:hypothetical protein